MIGHAVAQKRHVRIPIRPRAFVPAPADDPLSLWHLASPRLDPLDRFGLGLHADQIHTLERSAKLRKMNVRIDDLSFAP